MISKHVVLAALAALALGALGGCNNESITADAAATPDAPTVSGCGWNPDARRFQCGTNALPPTGEPDVVCMGEDCTYTDPSAMCLMETCDYETGEITLCQYSAGACPCEVTDCD